MAALAVGQETGVVVTVEDKLCVLKLNRPHKKNALRTREYQAIIAALHQAASDPAVSIVAVTGEGDYFSSGNDFVDVLQNSNALPSDGDVTEQKKKPSSVKSVREFIAALIDFPKPLVAVLNGPAVGISVTTLALYDIVYASDKATFHTPFVSLGMVAEGCSSFTFPRLMGQAKAAEVLLFEKKLTAAEAYDRNLVTEVFPHARLHEVWPRIQQYTKLPPNTLVNVKNQLRVHHRELLHKVNVMEIDTLIKASTSEETFNAIMNKFAKKSKL